MNSPLAFESAEIVSQNLLASTEDLRSALAHLVDPGKSHPNRHQHNQRLAHAALFKLLANISLGDQPRRGMSVKPAAAQKAAPQQAGTGIAANKHESSTDGRSSRLRRRPYCECGHCKWCVDNVRWDRIYNERFADPAYYGGIVVRHRSPLAEAR